MSYRKRSCITAMGIVTITTRKNGVVQDQVRQNLVVNVGKKLLAQLIGGLDSSVAVGTIAVGTDSATPVAANTVLGAEIYREASSAALITTTTTDDTCQFTMTIDEGDSSADGALTEAGLFGGNASNVLDPADGTGNDSGVLLSRVTFPVITKTPAVSLTIQWDIIFQ